ncbi:hypothetical protein B9W73_09545 [Lactococcus lactis]|uniref:DUF1642 domain-containing protein n=1 Tax=Lactococcus lactis TaxID=1358 RepID=UPI000A1E03A2|nr:DUF1642 domain-containing protein [Lactococcus lactis]OSP86500.1 hypothetical protein B9W73_09545 [Lactococcus lactis]
MTKFEEELNKIEVEVQTPLEKYIVEKAVADESLYAQHYEAVLEKFKDWHSDEEFQDEKDARKKEYEIHQDIYSKTAHKLNEAELEIANLKSQLQQQALPVVPECVDMAIKQFKNDQLSLYGSLNAILSDRTTEIYAWISRGNQDTFALAFITGKYEVEKPQLFYLKNTLTHEYLYRMYKASLGEKGYCKGTDGKPLSDCLFTLDEIESMNTGSYEQIKVEEEK